MTQRRVRLPWAAWSFGGDLADSDGGIVSNLVKLASRLGLAVAAVAGLVAVTGWFAGRSDIWQPAAVVASVAAAVGCRAIPALVTYQFTVWVLVTVVLGMLYPERCLSLGGLDM